MFVLDMIEQHQSFGQFLANWPEDDIVGLLLYLKKHGSRLGGRTSQYFLRFVGKDTFMFTQDVVTVNKTQPINDLSKLFIENHFNGVPVLDDAEKVIGVVTQGDLIEQNKNLRDMFRGLLVEKSNFQIGWNGRNKNSLESSSIAPTWIRMDVRRFSKKYLQEKYFDLRL